MSLTFGSVCSGIEAASVAWHPLGWRAAWVAEIEPFPCSLLAHHYPDVPNHGDMSVLPERVLLGDVEAPDILCGGTPCQAFSVAGLRRSLDDARGNLSLIFTQLANAIDERRLATDRQPCIVFWENVPGVLNTKDNAFGCFLAGLAGEDDALEPAGGRWSDAGVVLGPARAVAWRILDAQYFGLAQRRRRVFVVASAREGFDPAAVLLEFDGLRRDSAPSREAREGVAVSVIKGAAIGRKPDAGPQYGEHLDDGSCYTLNCVDQHAVVAGRSGVAAYPDPAYALTGGPKGNQFGTGRDAQDTFVTHAIAGSHWDDMRNPHPTLNQSAKGSGGIAASDQEVFSQRGGGLVPVAFTQNSRSEVRHIGGDGQVVGALAAEAGAQQQNYVALAVAHAFDARQSDVIQYGDKTGPLDTDGHTVGVLAFSSKDHGADATPDLSPTLRAMNHADSHANGGGQMAVAVDTYNHAISGDCAGSLTITTDGHAQSVVFTPAMQVRRLTPRECERLQGFPDDYTLVPHRGKPAADGPRYKALGNSWAVPVVRWIGQRIDMELLVGIC